MHVMHGEESSVHGGTAMQKRPGEKLEKFKIFIDMKSVGHRKRILNNN